MDGIRLFWSQAKLHWSKMISENTGPDFTTLDRCPLRKHYLPHKPYFVLPLYLCSTPRKPVHGLMWLTTNLNNNNKRKIGNWSLWKYLIPGSQQCQCWYQVNANRPDYGEHENAFSTNLTKIAASDQQLSKRVNIRSLSVSAAENARGYWHSRRSKNNFSWKYNLFVCSTDLICTRT